MAFRNSHTISGPPAIPPNIVKWPLSFQHFSSRLDFSGFLHGNPKPSRQQGWNHLDLSRLPSWPRGKDSDEFWIVQSSQGHPTIQRLLVTVAQEPAWGQRKIEQQSTSSPNATYAGPAFSSTCTAYRVAATGLSQKKWRISCLLSNGQFPLEPGSWVIQPCQKEQFPKTFCKKEHDQWKHMIMQYTVCSPTVSPFLHGINWSKS